MLDEFTIPEQDYMKRSSNSNSQNLKNLKAASGLETYFSSEINDVAVERSFLMSKLNLQEIKGSKIQKYLYDRLQYDNNKLAYDPLNNNIHIFNLTKENHVIGMQIKTFSKRNAYLTYKILNLHEMLGIYKETNKEILEKMNHLSNIFGIFDINLNKPVTVFEGPFDSFLFPNSLATSSAKNSVPFSLFNDRYLR
jgi:hypothetical protein